MAVSVPLEVLYVLAAVVIVLVVAVAYQQVTFRRKLGDGIGEAVRSHEAGEAKRTGMKVQESLKAQRGIVKGKVWEQIAPYLPEFEYNPADARFIGDPVDYVVFDGMGSGGEIEVVIIDVKTGRGQLNANQRRIRDAINGGRVSFRLVRLRDRDDPAA